MTNAAHLSIGVAGSLGPERIARIAGAVEAAGFHGLWVNDTPGGDALAALGAAAQTTDSLVLATGVLPVDRRPAAQIAAEAASLPQDRLVLGIGSGGMRHGIVPVMRAAVADLRRDTSGRVTLGALGPRMRRLAASDADGPLLSWLTPDVAAAQAAEARSVNADVRVSLYVRAALDDAAVERLRVEAGRYASYPSYAANFARLGIAADETVISPTDAESRTDAYRAAVDEVVLRAITRGDDDADYLRFVDQAAALL
jgi:alkanesulfonate monooxygenase SsuD/methylene tetrahydromethanopterin reductase-like flavin-dependent oxidoreductase (luciferase family)